MPIEPTPPTTDIEWVGDHHLRPTDVAHLPLFTGVADEQVEWLLSVAEVANLQPGDCCFTDGTPSDYMFLAIEGTVQFQIQSDGMIFYSVEFYFGEVFGVLPYSRMVTHTGSGIATTAARVMRVHRKEFLPMGSQAPELMTRLVNRLSDRVREAERVQHQREKMMALGKLSAGLAHELNNPAAAIRSSTKELLERLAAMPERVILMGRHDVSEDQLRSFSSLPQRLAESRNPELKPLERARLEDELTSWMEDHGVANSWRMAETFVDAGFTVADLEQMAAKTPPSAMADVLCWVEGHAAIYNLVREVSSATDRISALLASIKSYSHMDRALNKQLTPVHEGLEATLTMFGHKLKKKNVRVEKHYVEPPPLVMAMPGELNQVWTNLIDNAIDAMPSEGGVLRIDTALVQSAVLVTITDNGSGIPPDILDRIYEPFFTTKSLGEGTGLGLDIAHRIITRQHQGHIDVESRPGCTRFQVAIPLSSAPTRTVTQ
jgi:signal transduction histidine kinase